MYIRSYVYWQVLFATYLKKKIKYGESLLVYLKQIVSTSNVDTHTYVRSDSAMCCMYISAHLLFTRPMLALLWGEPEAYCNPVIKHSACRLCNTNCICATHSK